MAYNTYETIDNTLRGEPYGQMTPEGQSLWDQYQALLNAQKNPPMRNLNLRSGAQLSIPDPGFGMRNKALSRTLAGMNATGMGSRAQAQPGVLAQMSPLMLALGQKYGPQIAKQLQQWLNGGTPIESTPVSDWGGSDPGTMMDWGGSDPGTDYSSLLEDVGYW